MSTHLTFKANKLTPVHNHIIVKNMIFGERLTRGGILLPGDDKKSEGIRPRWCEVQAVGPKQHDVKVGEFLLVSHGRWSRGINMEIKGEEVVIRRIDPNDILLISDESQTDDTFTDAFVPNSDNQRLHGSLHNDGTNRES